MKIALIGATGFVGTALLKELTDRGHEVTAISRHPENIKLKSPLIHPVEGDVLDAKAVAQLVRGNDVVISAYNPGWTNPRIGEEIMKGSRAIQEGVKAAGVKRFIVIGGAGSLEHMAEVLLAGKADAVLAASIFHFGTYTVADVKKFLSQKNIPVRL